MKLILMIDDETWFWVYNDETSWWEAFYECGDEPAKRLLSNDTRDLDAVLALMRLRTLRAL